MKDSGRIVGLLYRSRRSLISGLALFLLAPSPAISLDNHTVRRDVTPGDSVVLLSATCIRVISPASEPTLKLTPVEAGHSQYLIFEAPPAFDSTIAITLEVGSKPLVGAACLEGETKTFEVVPKRENNLDPESTAKVGRILFFAFALAVLLESAFSLIFNWRLFLEFASGKAWKTPVMFIGALAVVRNFHADIFASLVALYAPYSVASDTGLGWMTSILSALILGGGSTGVNQLLIALGFRTRGRPETDMPAIHENEAWLSVRVSDYRDALSYQVNVTELPVDPDSKTPATLAILRKRSFGDRLAGIFLTNPLRTPPVGGRKVSTLAEYSVTVMVVGRTPQSILYDADGRMLSPMAGSQAAPLPATRYRFSSRAIVDMVINLPPP